MKVTSKEKDLKSIIHKLRWLRSREVNRALPISEWEGRLLEYQAPQKYRNLSSWEKIHTGRYFEREGTLLLRKKLQIPVDFKAESTFLEVKFEFGEGLVSINGRISGAVDREHTLLRIPPDCLHMRSLSIEIEVWLNVNASIRSGFGGKVIFQSARIIELNETIWRYCIHLETALDLLDSMSCGENVMAEKIQLIAHSSIYMVKFEEKGKKLEESIQKADRYLEDALSKLSSSVEGKLYLAGHTHIDTGWLWPYKETVRKCGRTFINMLSLMEAYPTFTFSCSQPQLFEFTKKYYPEVYEKIKKYVREGRWEPIGVLWVESDINIPSGESLIRQILYGDRFYKQEFGTYTPIAWLPDVFGYSPNMPQILKKAGIRYFLTCKVYWQKENVFPYRLFWWEGIDGSRVLAHTPWTGQMYNNNPTPQLYLFTWKNFTEKENYDGVLIPYGFGDGGGGPTPEQVERCILMSKIPILPKSEFSTVSTYFKDAEKKAKDLPVWFGEIYVESHRGTLTSQAWLKKANRYTENLYREAEIFSSLSRIMGEEIDIEKLTEGWKLILLNQFHDVLSGTSTPEVYLDSRRDHKKINQWGEEILEKALSVIVNRHVLSDAKKGICVFNPSSWVRSEIVEIDCSTNSIFKGLKTIEGNPVPVQILRSEGGKRKLIFEVEEVSPFGFQYYETTDKEFEFSQNEMKVRPQLLENEFIRIELRVDGLIERIISKTSGRQFIEDGKVANLIQLFIDGPLDDEAWNIDPAFEEIVSDITGAIEISVMESGPLRGRIRVKRRFGKSKITQDIIIYRKKSVVDFRTYVDWQETQKMLKVSFPTNLKAQYATYEVAYGVYQRPTYRNNPWERQLFEVSMHRFVDISEGNRGVALLNDCKYGGDVSGGRIRLTLLRAPTHPHPKLDRGEHLFTYSLYVHEGDWRTGQVVHRAAELNNPLLVRRVGREKGKTPAVAQAGFILVEPENIIVEVMKRCEDEDATLLRAYECHGNLTRATFEFPFQVKEIVESDLLEQPKRKIASGKRRFEIEFGPFEIKTFILYI